MGKTLSAHQTAPVQGSQKAGSPSDLCKSQTLNTIKDPQTYENIIKQCKSRIFVTRKLTHHIHKAERTPQSPND